MQNCETAAQAPSSSSPSLRAIIVPCIMLSVLIPSPILSRKLNESFGDKCMRKEVRLPQQFFALQARTLFLLQKHNIILIIITVQNTPSHHRQRSKMS